MSAGDVFHYSLLDAPRARAYHPRFLQHHKRGSHWELARMMAKLSAGQACGPRKRGPSHQIKQLWDRRATASTNKRSFAEAIPGRHLSFDAPAAGLEGP